MPKFYRHTASVSRGQINPIDPLAGTSRWDLNPIDPLAGTSRWDLNPIDPLAGTSRWDLNPIDPLPGIFSSALCTSVNMAPRSDVSAIDLPTAPHIIMQQLYYTIKVQQSKQSCRRGY